jgi:hypothetical protein
MGAVLSAFFRENLSLIVWVLLYLFGFFYYLSTKKYGGWRGLFSYWVHLSFFLIGWQKGAIFGAIFVSIPLLALYYYFLYRLAEVIILPSDPDDPQEKIQRFKTLSRYMWGLQFPILMVPEPTSISAETRIEGSPFQLTPGTPGYIWSDIHQVVGITTGPTFSRVQGPGAIYTGPFERPQEVVDLRTQLRTTEVNAQTQDGISIKAIVFAAFRVDRSAWEAERYNRLVRANPLLQGGMQADTGKANFLYSPQRVRAVLGLGGVKTTTAEPPEDASIRWDEQVMNLVGEAARQVLSEIPLSELWLPNREEDGVGVSALDLIADKINDRVSAELQENGVQLFTARVVNYSLPEDTPENKVDRITRPQLQAWRERWEQKVNLELAETEAEVEQKISYASVLARSLYITEVAKALKEHKLTGKDINRYLIAVRVLSVIDELSDEKEPDERNPASLLRYVFSQLKK